MRQNIDPFPERAIPYLFKYTRLYKWHIFVSFMIILLAALVSNLGNWFFAQIIETIKNGVSDENMRTALKFVCLLGLCAILNIFTPKIAIMYRQKHFYFPVQADITKNAIAYIQGHSVNYISSNQTGMFVNKMDQILALQPILSMIIVGSWQIICEIIIKTFILMMINIWLGLMFLSFTVLSCMFNEAINKKSERLNKMNNRIESTYSGWLVDVIANMRFVKHFNKLDFEKNRLFALLTQWFGIKKKALFQGTLTYTYVGVFINIFSMIIISFAVYLWSIGKVGVGDIVFVLLTLTGGLNYLSELHDIIRQIRNKLAAMDEGLKPFAVPHEIQDIEGAINLKVSKGEIEFKDVDFSYNNKKNLFKGFNLKIGKCEKIGIVGRSGSGKTTLINLLERAYEPQSGQILIDNKDISKVTQESLHENIALIPQETTLFHRTIKENIAFGNPKASDEEIFEASKKAYADKFISSLPDGYETHVGDRGCKLSGGEKQRIAIARAILKDSPILILDEATSALDSESEYLISEAISKMIEGKIVIAIAHRLSTLKEMDRIVVIDKGKIAEVGKFADLIKIEGGKFAKFYKLQQMKNKKKGKSK